MHFLWEHWLWVWRWLTGENGARATVLLVFITALYAWLTYLMAKAMNRQTRAQVQPVLEIDITVAKDEFLPKGSFRLKNVGSQSALLRHMRMTCRRDGIEEYDEYMMYERHLMTPNDSLHFNFDFTEKFTKRGIRAWSPGMCSFNLWVVASDLGEDVTLTYVGNQYWKTLGVVEGMPWWIRKKLVTDYFKRRYNRILYKIRPPKLVFSRPKAEGANTQTEASPKEKPGWQGNGSHDAQ